MKEGLSTARSPGVVPLLLETEVGAPEVGQIEKDVSVVSLEAAVVGRPPMLAPPVPPIADDAIATEAPHQAELVSTMVIAGRPRPRGRGASPASSGTTCGIRALCHSFLKIPWNKWTGTTFVPPSGASHMACELHCSH